jgi:predicted DNA-binding protein
VDDKLGGVTVTGSEHARERDGVEAPHVPRVVAAPSIGWETRPRTMARKKVSTTVYIEPEQAERLKVLHERTKVPVAVYIREGIELVLAKYEHLLPGQLTLEQQRKQQQGGGGAGGGTGTSG